MLRAEPCLFGLYTLVVWLYAELPARYRRVRAVDWPGKSDVTFSDAITAVRRWLWVEWVFAIPGHREAFQNSGSVAADPAQWAGPGGLRRAAGPRITRQRGGRKRSRGAPARSGCAPRKSGR